MRRRYYDFISLLIVAMMSTPTLGAPVALRVHLMTSEPGKTSPPPATVQVQIACTGDGDVKRTVAYTDGAIVDLPPGVVCYLTPHAVDVWGEQQVAIASPAVTSVDLRLWPAATLKARLEPETTIRDLSVEFQSDDSIPAGVTGLRGSSECAVDDAQVTCVLPAGTIDYSLRSTGHIPIYRWNQRVSAHSVLDLGTIRMRRGSSLFGRVAAPRQRPHEPNRSP